MNAKLNIARLAILWLGFAFLYTPIALVVIYSFNASRLVTLWGGWSLHWYGALFANTELMTSAATSLEAALLSGAIATVLGTLAATALARFGRFHGRSLFFAMLSAPLVLPEVIMGLSLLLLFVALDIERGFITLVIAHTTLSLGFVTITVLARLRDFDPALEEAAADLGAGPVRAFVQVVLPLIAPSVAAGFLLAVTLSLDDLILASFTTGPGTTTLPMRIYSAVRLGVSPQINAISTLLIMFVAVSLGLALAMRRQR